MCITLFCRFLCRFCTTTTWLFRISCFTKDVKMRRRNCIALSEFEYVPLEFKFRMVRVHFTKLVSRNNRDKNKFTFWVTFSYTASVTAFSQTGLFLHTPSKAHSKDNLWKRKTKRYKNTPKSFYKINWSVKMSWHSTWKLLATGYGLLTRRRGVTGRKL